MQLPLFKTDNQELSLMQIKWKSILDGLLANPLSQSILLPNVALASGDNVINHRLGRKLTGWMIVRQRASASVYDKQDANQSPALTLVLNSSGAVIVDLEVF